VASVLLLPLLWLVLPNWRVAIRSSAAPVVARASLAQLIAPSADRVDAESSTVMSPPYDAPLDPPGTRARSLRTAIATLYAAGAILMLMQLAVQHWRLRRFVATATLVRESPWMRLLEDCAGRIGVRHRVRLLRSQAHLVPLTFGLRRPSIVVPADADAWADDRRRAVLLHELAHVARHDCLTQTLACCARAIYWFNPVAWWLARRLRIERELACDDRVIAAGTEPRDYAGHLLEIAYAFGGRRSPTLAVGMAGGGQLEGRMLAALDGARNRSVPTIRMRAAGVTLAAGFLAAITGATPTMVGGAGAVDEASAGISQAAVLPESVGPIQWPFEKDVRQLVQDAAALTGLAEEDAPGTWEIRPTGTSGTVHLRLAKPHSSHGSNVPVERLEGLTASQLTGAGGPVRFRLRRDAGSFEFDGVLRNGVGAGTFSFTADPGFPEALSKRAFARPSAREQYQLAWVDIGYEFVDELVRQGYAKAGIPDIVRAGQHGVSTAYLRDMGALGYRLKSLDPLITLRDHGVTPEYARDLAALGYKGLSADDLRQARDHGVTPDYVRGMREAGYQSVPMDTLIGARDHGVTVEFVRGLADAGHRAVPLQQLIQVRDHGVSPEYVRALRELGFTVSLDELVNARDHGVTAEYIRAMVALGHTNLPLESLVRLRDHGVTPEYAQELKALGYDRVAADDLITLRDHGLTPERIRDANTRAGSRLPIDQLKSFAARGSI
jgi:beta-lactamase regulating signal transducer with metallopeptidase domain